jgi:hypothetical protein
MDVLPAPPAASARTTLQVTRAQVPPEYLPNYEGHANISTIMLQKLGIISRQVCH